MRRNAGYVSPRRPLQRKPLASNPGVHHGTCVTHVPWCMSGSRWRGKRSRHSRRMRTSNFTNPTRGSCWELSSWLLLGDCYRTHLMISQHWFWSWLGAPRHYPYMLPVIAPGPQMDQFTLITVPFRWEIDKSRALLLGIWRTFIIFYTFRKAAYTEPFL